VFCSLVMIGNWSQVMVAMFDRPYIVCSAGASIAFLWRGTLSTQERGLLGSVPGALAPDWRAFTPHATSSSSRNQYSSPGWTKRQA